MKETFVVIIAVFPSDEKHTKKRDNNGNCYYRKLYQNRNLLKDENSIDNAYCVVQQKKN